MTRSTSATQARHGVLHLLFLASGIIGLVFFSTVDFLHLGTPHLGMDQLAGLVISAIIVLAGLRDPASPGARTWFGILLLLYVGGMLVMGLVPTGHVFHHPRTFFSLSSPLTGDFIINVVGFAPFAYLFMTYHFAGRPAPRHIRTALLVLAAGMAISLLIELLQYDIPGRSSSLMDVIANTLGTALGAGYFLLEKTEKKAAPTDSIRR